MSRSQCAHPSRFLIGAAVATAVAVLCASRLSLDSSYEALLPENDARIASLVSVRNEIGGYRPLVISVEGRDRDARIAFGRALAERLGQLHEVRRTELETPIDFLRDRSLWLADTDTLDMLVAAVESAVAAERTLADPLGLHLDEAEERRATQEAWHKVDALVDANREKSGVPPVFQESADGRRLFVTLIPAIAFADMAAGRALLDRVQREIDALSPLTNGISVRFAGPLAVYQETHRVMSEDLRRATVISLVGVILVVALLARRILAPVLIGASLIPGIAWTLGLVGAAAGDVNVITGFGVAVLLGLGVDFGAHLYISFMQERVRLGSIEDAVRSAVVETAPPAVSSALTTAGVFYTFSFSAFRGFSELGWVVGTGVLLTLVSSFLVLPPLLMVFARFEKKRIVRPPLSPRNALPKRRFVFVAAVSTVIVFGAVAFAGAIGAPGVRFHNNLRALRGTSPATEFFDSVDADLRGGFDPAVVLTRTEGDAAKAAAIARQQSAERVAGGSASRIRRVLSMTDILPTDVEERGLRIERLRALLDDPKLDSAISSGGPRAEKLADARRRLSLPPWTRGDLPESLRRRFETVRGDRLITYIWPDAPNDTDARALSWERELFTLARRLEAAGVSATCADESLILAWISDEVRGDGPVLLLVASALVLALVAVHMRSARRTLVAAAPLAVGLGVYVALIRASGVGLNMYNMMILPSVVGMGIDNILHIEHRHRSRGSASIGETMRGAWVAVSLASVTTAVGFGATVAAHNAGIVSFGVLAVLGIGAMFASAIAFFPALLLLLERKKPRRAEETP